MEEIEDVWGLNMVEKPGPVKLSSVTAGGVLCAPAVDVDEITSGGMVFTEEVIGEIDTISSGGVLVAGNIDEIERDVSDRHVFQSTVEFKVHLVEKLQESLGSSQKEAAEHELEAVEWAMKETDVDV